MKSKFTINELVVKVPGQKLPKVLDLSSLDKHTRDSILKAYNESTIYAPNLTASKSEKLSAAMSQNISEFRRILNENSVATASNISSAFCMAFDFDSIHCPNIVKLIQSIAHCEPYRIDIDALCDILFVDHNITFSAAELYAEFQGWKYYEMIKACVGGVSVVKFMRFYLGMIQSIKS